MKSISIRIEDDLLKKVDESAERSTRNRSNMINYLIKFYYDNYEQIKEFDDDYKEANFINKY